MHCPDQYRAKRKVWQKYSMRFRQVPPQEVWDLVQRGIREKFSRMEKVGRREKRTLNTQTKTTVSTSVSNNEEDKDLHGRYDGQKHGRKMKDMLSIANNKDLPSLLAKQPEITDEKTNINFPYKQLSKPKAAFHKIPISVIAACRTACDVQGNPTTIILDKRGKENNNKEKNRIRDKTGKKSSGQWLGPNLIKSAYEKTNLTKNLRHISNTDKGCLPGSQEHEEGSIVLLPCSNCGHVTVVYPCSCNTVVYCGVVCQVGKLTNFSILV